MDKSSIVDNRNLKIDNLVRGILNDIGMKSLLLSIINNLKDDVPYEVRLKENIARALHDYEDRYKDGQE